MSEFFKALQRADEERARRQRATPEAAEAEAAVPETVTFAPTVLAMPGAPRIGSESVESHLVTLLAPASLEADHYRVLRDVVEQRRNAGPFGVVAVTSPGAGDGKTTTAINLAGALAQDEQARVLLIDADLRNPSVADRLALENPDGRGLTDAILDPGLPLARVVRRLPRFNLSVLDSGGESSMPYEVLRLPRLGELLDEARRSYDHVILDVPPALPFPDCRVIGRWIDGFLVVVTAHRTQQRRFEQALKTLDPALVAGIVFNGNDSVVDTSYARYARRNGHHAGLSAAVRRTAARWRVSA